MKVKMILPALTEATSPFWRPIKYSLFPPLGLATLAAYLRADDEVEIQDEHVERLHLDDTPDLVVIQVYITSAYRAYRLADHYRRRGAHVALGGLHVTSLPDEAAPHADTIFLGPGEDTWPKFLADVRGGDAARVYRSEIRTLEDVPPIRRDLIKRHLYLDLVIRAKRAGMMLPVLETILAEFGKRCAEASTSVVDHHDTLGASTKYAGRFGVPRSSR